MAGRGTWGRGDGQDDPFERLLDPSLDRSAAPREPSADERLASAQRAARAADLQRRLDADAAFDASLSRAGRASRRRRVLGWTAGAMLAAAFVAVVIVHEPEAGSGLLPGPRPSNYPPVDSSASDEPLGAAPAPPPNPADFEFMRLQEDGTAPVAWDPCRPVRYVVNPEGAPPRGEQLLQTAVERLASATGLRFESVSTTDERWSNDREPYQPERYGDRWAPALLTWADEDSVPALGGYVAGLGGGQPASDPETGAEAYVTGSIVLDADDIGRVAGEDIAQAVVIVQHELAHMIGLAHVADPTQVMNTEGTEESPNDWGTGDLAGLSELGSGACYPML